VLNSAPAVAQADWLPLQLPLVRGGVCWSWPARGLGFVWAGQVAAGQPGIVQARVQAGGPARSTGTRLDGQTSSHIRACSSWMARSAASGRHAARRKVAPRRRADWAAVIKITSFV
jgi:hypothetical protein